LIVLSVGIFQEGGGKALPDDEVIEEHFLSRPDVGEDPAVFVEGREVISQADIPAVEMMESEPRGQEGMKGHVFS